MARNATLSDMSTETEKGAATPHPPPKAKSHVKEEVVGASIGGTTGGLTGAAIGTAVGGPVGAAIGAVAGVVVGALSGKAIADANAEDEDYWREEYFRRPYYKPGDLYEAYVDAYRFGSKAAQMTPDLQFSDVEKELAARYGSSEAAQKLPYEKARGPIVDAYDRRRRRIVETTSVSGISAAAITGAAAASPSETADKPGMAQQFGPRDNMDPGAAPDTLTMDDLAEDEIEVDGDDRPR